jgi:hypothetical protein
MGIPKIDKHLALKYAVYTCSLQDSQTSSDYQKDPSSSYYYHDLLLLVIILLASLEQV